MKVRCPDCGSKGVLNAELAGQMARCSRCGSKFVAKAEPAGEEGIKWYYAEGDQKKGPLSEDAFALLIGAGTITPETLVWRKGMRGWQTLMETRGEETVFIPHQEEAEQPVASLAPRPTGEEKAIREATPAGWSADLVPAGGAKRLFAKIIDLVFMAALATLVEGLSRKLFPDALGGSDSINKVYVVTMTIAMLLGMLYITWFTGKFGATPGKMVFSLKVVKPLGAKVGYLQAFARYCSEFVLILAIASMMVVVVLMFSQNFALAIAAFLVTLLPFYLPIFFDPQRRGFPDRLCRTRVVAV